MHRRTKQLWFAMGAVSVACLLIALATVAGARGTSAHNGAKLTGIRTQAVDEPIDKTSSLRRDTTNKSCNTSGKGTNYLNVCISIHGNVAITSPSGNPLLSGYEGYTLCDGTGLQGYDSKFGGSGFGGATYSQPNGPNTFPLTVTRYTGNYRLIQTFTRDAAERDVTITMAIKNLTGATRSGIYLFRYFDGDLDNTSGGDIYDDSADSVWGREAHALSLSALSGQTHNTWVSSFSDLNSTLGVGTCYGLVQPGPTAPGDWTGAAWYSVPSLGAGVTKTLKFTYRVF